MKYSALESLLCSTIQPERRLHLDKTLYEMAITSSTIYGLIGLTTLVALLFPTPEGLMHEATALTGTIALLTGIFFYLIRHHMNLLLANLHMFLAIALISVGLWTGQSPASAAIGMIYILTTLYAFHFFTLPTNLLIITLIGASFATVAHNLNWVGWPSLLILLIGCCITGGVVINLLVKRINWLATTDKLTGAFNRHTWDAILNNALSYAERHSQPISIILVDLDHFKTINDKQGHQAGDKILQATVHAIQSQLRKSDTLARWGGDEFIALLPDCDHENARIMAERLKHRLSGVSSFTTGVAQYQSGDTADSLISRADSHLLRQKAARPSPQ